MNVGKVLEGDCLARNARFGVICSRFNADVCQKLLDGAIDTLVQNGAQASQIHVVRVPGAYEVTFAAKTLAASGAYDALIALGAVVRGETPNFEFVSSACVEGLSRVGYDFDIPVGFGVLTVNEGAQASARAGGKKGNKGIDAALAALEMLNLKKQVRST